MPKHRNIAELLAAVFDRCREGDDDPDTLEERRRDFVFHMTDWAEDLPQLAALYQNPEQVDRQTASRFLVGFLYHTIPHLKAAGRLLLDEIPDAFDPSAQPAQPLQPKPARKRKMKEKL